MYPFYGGGYTNLFIHTQKKSILLYGHWKNKSKLPTKKCHLRDIVNTCYRISSGRDIPTGCRGELKEDCMVKGTHIGLEITDLGSGPNPPLP